jgi:hypothetical protein
MSKDYPESKYTMGEVREAGKALSGQLSLLKIQFGTSGGPPRASHAARRS